jgi:hypothetical protein
MMTQKQKIMGTSRDIGIFYAIPWEITTHQGYAGIHFTKNKTWVPDMVINLWILGVPLLLDKPMHQQLLPFNTFHQFDTTLRFRKVPGDFNIRMRCSAASRPFQRAGNPDTVANVHAKKTYKFNTTNCV